jgi:hypothetical protein
LKPFETTCAVETLGEGTATAADSLKVMQNVQIHKLQLQHSSWQDSERGASLVESEISVFACRSTLEDSDT